MDMRTSWLLCVVIYPKFDPNNTSAHQRAVRETPGTRLEFALSQISMRGFFTLTHFGFHSKEGSCFSCRESKLSTFGEYCGFAFGVKVSFEGYSFSVTY